MDRERLEAEILSRDWFYEFPLPGGQTTRSNLPEEVRSIHHTRERMIFDELDRRFDRRWSELRALDLGCHEGYFSVQLAKRGCREVLGIDAREENLANARLIRDVYGLTNLDFRQGSVLELDESIGRFDVVLMLGLLYHVPDIIGVLQLAAAVTANVCMIETQIAPDPEMEVEWGSRMWKKRVQGWFGIVDETDAVESGNREASLRPISLVPSRSALLYLLPHVGFKEVEVLPAPPGANEQLARGERIVIAASA